MPISQTKSNDGNQIRTGNKAYNATEFFGATGATEIFFSKRAKRIFIKIINI
jgi:hypothetical protein